MRSDDNTVSILVSFGSSMACELYAQALRRHKGFTIVGHAASVVSGVEIARHKEIDVALIAIDLTDGPNSGLSAMKQLRECQPDVKSIVLLDRSQIELVIAAFRAGARGVFDPSRDNALQRLKRCIQKVNAGQIWATGAELVRVLDALSQPVSFQIVDSQGMKLLTKREEDVVRLVAGGLTNRQIGFELNLSENTVRNNLFRVFDKLGVSTRVELALRAANSF